MKAIKQFISEDGQKKVEIFQRADGTFGFTDWRYDREEDSWYPHGRYSECFASSFEIAVREASGRVDWLRELLRIATVIVDEV